MLPSMTNGNLQVWLRIFKWSDYSWIIQVKSNVITRILIKRRQRVSHSWRCDDGNSGERGERGGSSLGPKGASITEGPLGLPCVSHKVCGYWASLCFFFLIFASTAQHANPVSRSFPPQVRVRKCGVLWGQVGAEKGVIRSGVALDVPKSGATNPMDGHGTFSRSWESTDQKC